MRDEGLGIVAVTVWSLLDAYDWDSLLTRFDGRYESGVFDVSNGTPRPTALAAIIRDLASGKPAADPLLTRPGWWRHDARLAFPPHMIAAPSPSQRPADSGAGCCAPLLILGASGTLGQAFAGACRLRDIPHILTDRASLSLDDAIGIGVRLDEVRPWAVINAAGWVRVDHAEEDPAACLAANRDGSLRLAGSCAERGIPLTSFSSDLVFDGLANRAYVEGDALAPLGVYGRSKAAADTGLLALDGEMLVMLPMCPVRTHPRW